MNKVFKKYPKLGTIWSIAWQELAKATDVVFIGVSFAPSDYYLRWLVKSAFLTVKDQNANDDRKIIVVDKYPSVKEKIREMVGMDPIHYHSIETYISKEIEIK